MKVINKINRDEIINFVEQKQMKKDIPEFSSGDYICVHNRIQEGNKSRIQKFEGVCLRRKGKGLSETFIIRRESDAGVWVEENFQLHSPRVEKIEVLKKGKVRRAYITYMRKRTGKATRIKEKR